MSNTFDAAAFRHRIHERPSLSGQEGPTAEFITSTLVGMGFAREQIHSGIGGAGFTLTVKGTNPGPTTLFRSELDGLPIQEKATHDRMSKEKGKMHACGHDGHMANLVSFAHYLHSHPPQYGSVILLFQPAEETGEGARAMLEDTQWEIPSVDYVFGFHNVPGYPIGQVLLRSGTFACASTGVEITLQGLPSHAAYPENGVSPVMAISELLQELHTIPSRYPNTLAMCTVCYVSAGERAYGTAVGSGTMGVTLRSDDPQVFEQMKEFVHDKLQTVSASHGIQGSLQWVEPFEATVNHQPAVTLVRAAAEQEKRDV